MVAYAAPAIASMTQWSPVIRDVERRERRGLPGIAYLKPGAFEELAAALGFDGR